MVAKLCDTATAEPTGLCFRLVLWASLLLCLPLAAKPSLKAQQSPLDLRVTLPHQRTTVYRVLSNLSDSINYHFVYDSQVVPSDRRISYGAMNKTVRAILADILPDTSLRFSVMGQHILIYRMENAMPPPPLQNPLLYLTISGQVFDYQTRKPIPFAAVGIREAGLGNVTNSDGLFVLRVPSELSEYQLTISHLGYRSSSYPVRLLSTVKTDIFLHTEAMSIQEVIIRNIDPGSIVAKAVASIPLNFSSSPTILTTFYREGIHINRKLLNYSEGVFSIFKPAYSNRFESVQAKLLKMRTMSNLDHTDSLVIKLKGGIGSGLALDIARNLPSFLDPEFTPYYTYYKSDIVTIGSRSAYAIGFEQKKGVNEPLLKGIIYIDMETLAILKAEFEVNPDMVSQTTGQHLARGSRRYTIRADRVAYTVSFAELNGKYHLSHVRGDLAFRYRLRRRIRYNTFNAFLELATSRIDTLNVKRFGWREVTPTTMVFTDMRMEYDAGFWENLNYIAPEKSLQDALGDINIRLQQMLGTEEKP